MIDTQNSRLNFIFIAWFLVVAIVPSIFVAVFSYSFETRRTEEAVHRDLALVARLKVQQLQSYAGYTMQDVHRTVTAALATEGVNAELRRRIDAAAQEGSARLVLVDDNGAIVYPALGSSEEISIAEVASPERVPRVSIVNGTVRFSYPVASAGLWLVEVQSQEAINTILHEHINDARFFSRGRLLGIRDDLGTTADSILLDAEGKPLSDSLTRGTLDPSRAVDATLSRWISESRDTVLSGRRVLGSRDVFAHARRLDVFGQQAVLLTTVEAGEILGLLYEQRREYLLTYIGALLAALVLLYFFVRMTSKRVIGPIQLTIDDAVRSAEKIRESMRRSEKTLSEQDRVARSLSESYREQLGDIKAVEAEIGTIVSSLGDISRETQVTLKNAQAIETLAERSRTEAKEAKDSMSSIKLLATAHDVLLSTLSEYSTRVDGIAADMRRIAESTKYLSLNASVEAGHSEGGTRQLSGLVSEVGKLSVLSREASLRINELVKSIQQQLSQSQESSTRVRKEAEGSLGMLNDALERLNRMSDDAVNIAKRVRVIDQAVTRQSQSTVEIAGHSKDLTSQARLTLRVATRVNSLVSDQARGISASSAAHRRLEGIIGKLRKLIGSRRQLKQDAKAK